MNKDLRTARRSTALMRTLSSDYLLREQFVTDPAGLYAEYVGGKTTTAEAGNATNQLLYAVASNPELLQWLGDLGSDSRADLDDDALARGLIGAASKSGDDAVLTALVGFGSSEKVSIKPALDLIRGLALGLRGSGRQSGTNVSPGTGTNVSPGTGTNVSPARGTNVSPGTGTNVSPGTGTNVSPGTGTNVSPGTGTNVSVGGIFGRFGDFQVVLRALVDYANELRRAGVLNQISIR